uniref:Anoctamin n=1 Tax=Plectus sambesii TaxID=2011161 RepID=A0A914V0A2_9BILA
MDGDQPVLPHTDYVLVYEASDLSLANPRKLFEQAMELEGLQLERQTIGDLVFVKVFAPFKRLAMEAERINLEMPLKGCELEPKEPTCCITLSKLLVTDDQVDFVSAPFEVDKWHLYAGSEDPKTFFRTSSRNLLVHHILINIDIHNELRLHPDEDPDDEDGLRRRGLLYLLMKEAYTDAFVLHEQSVDEPYYEKLKEKSPEEYESVVNSIKKDSRQELNKRWTKLWKYQPLWKIRDYFGESIAFYFAWHGTFLTMLWLPSAIGIAIFFYGLSLSLDDDPAGRVVCSSTVDANGTVLTMQTNSSTSKSLKAVAESFVHVIQESFDTKYSSVFSLLICLWGALFLEIWKRNRHTLAYEWDCEEYNYSEPDRPEFYGTKKQPNPVTGELEWTYPQLERLRKAITSFLFVAASVCVVFASVAGVALYKVVMRVQLNCTAELDDDASNDAKEGKLFCVFMITIVPTVLNSLSIMILGYLYTKLVYKLTDWENHRTQSDYNNALIIKLFAFQFVNTYTSLFYTAFYRPEENGFQTHGIFNLGSSYKDTCTRGTCMSLLSLQVLVLMVMKPFPKLTKDFILPYVIWYGNKVIKRLGGAIRTTKRVSKRGKREQTMTNVPSDGTHNAAEAEETNLLWREWRKPPLGDFTLAEYNEKIIQYGYVMMFSSSFPLAPFLALAIGLIDMRLDAKRLLWFNRRPIAFVAADIGMWFPVLRFVTLCGVISNAFIVAYTSDFCDLIYDVCDCSAAQRLTIVVVFENFVLLAIYIISGVVPDQPSSINLAQRRERYAVARIMEGEFVPGTKQYITVKNLFNGDGQPRASKKTICSTADNGAASPRVSEANPKWTRLHRQGGVDSSSPSNIPAVLTPLSNTNSNSQSSMKKSRTEIWEERE